MSKGKKYKIPHKYLSKYPVRKPMRERDRYNVATTIKNPITFSIVLGAEIISSPKVIRIMKIINHTANFATTSAFILLLLLSSHSYSY